MKLQLKSLSVFVAASAIIATACSGNKEHNDSCANTNADIRGKWYLENIVLNDSMSVRPAEETPDIPQYVIFDDSTYSIRTNCNSISGPYYINGDSITLGDGPMTEMACDNMATEDALREILPNIATICIENDSTARLNSRNQGEYVVLRKEM